MRFLVVIWLILCLVAVSVPQSSRKKSSGQNLNRKLNSVRQNQAKVRRELAKAKAQSQWVVQDIDRVDKRLTVVAEQLDETIDNLNSNKRTQKQIAEDLIETSHRLNVTREQLRRRLRAIYVEGDSSYMAVLAGTQSIGDLASRTDLLGMIAARDRDLFNRFAELKKKVSTRKSQQDRVVTEIGRLARHHQVKQSELKDVRQEKRQALQSLQAKQSQLRVMLAQYAADERSIESQIASYMRRLEAERRKRMVAKRVKRGNRYVTVNVPAPPLVFRGGFSRPVRGSMTSRFGMRHHPILGIRRLHSGVDFGGGYGAPIYAAAAGEVISSSYMRGYGNCVIIDHGSGMTTVYAHCSRVLVRAGQRVGRGQRIAAIGSTGMSTGPHLHFEVRVNGRAVNPLGRL